MTSRCCCSSVPPHHYLPQNGPNLLQSAYFLLSPRAEHIVVESWFSLIVWSVDFTDKRLLLGWQHCISGHWLANTSGPTLMQSPAPPITGHTTHYNHFTFGWKRHWCELGGCAPSCLFSPFKVSSLMGVWGGSQNIYLSLHSMPWFVDKGVSYKR